MYSLNLFLQFTTFFFIYNRGRQTTAYWPMSPPVVFAQPASYIMVFTSINDIECPGCDKNTTNIPGEKTKRLKIKKKKKKKKHSTETDP